MIRNPYTARMRLATRPRWSAPQSDPFDGDITFYPNWYSTTRLGVLRERVFVAAPVSYSAYRFAVNVTPKPGILDPQGRAVERSLPHLGIEGVSAVRVGRRVELTVEAQDEREAGATVDRLASELLSNPLIEAYEVERVGDTAGVAR